MATKKISERKADDMRSLCEHIEGHIGFLRDALSRNDRAGVQEQAAEIEAWGQSLRQAAEKA